MTGMNPADHINNDPRQIEIRRYQNNLIIMGTGVIALGVWNIVKTAVILVIMREETLKTILQGAGTELVGVSNALLYTVLIVIALIFLLAVLALRLYIGLSAIAEGRGTKVHGRTLYLLLTAVLILISFGDMVSGAVAAASSLTSWTASSLASGTAGNDASFSAVIIDFTSMIMMTEMAYSALRIRKLRAGGKHSKGA